MSSVVELILLVVAIAVIVAVARRRRAHGSREIARLSITFCTFLDDVVARDGRVALEQYTTDDRTLAMSELHHLARSTHDRRLRRHLVRALDAYDHSLALALPSAADLASPSSPQDALLDEQRTHQLESAEISREAFGAVLDRARRLDHRALRSD